MDLSAPAVRSTNMDLRLIFATCLLLLAAIPVQVFAVPGFEVTPSLLLAPAALLLFDFRDKSHWAVVLFTAFCGFLALIGETGDEGRLRNLLGAASYSSGAPYILVGMLFAKRGFRLDQVWRIVACAASGVCIILLIDLYLTGGNIVQSAAFSSVSYQAEETTFIASTFPFYGKYAVITLATIIMVLGGLGIASASGFSAWPAKVVIITLSTILVFLSFVMWTRQVMAGAVVFYLILSLLAFWRKETWISLAVIAALAVPVVYYTQFTSHRTDPSEVVGTAAIGANKMATSIQDIEAGNLDELSTGRLPLYRAAISKITPEILAKGCGFCNLMDVMQFPFSSLHNVILTAIYKGGLVYTVLYLGGAFAGLVLLPFTRRSFARNVTLAVMGSIAVQSMVNDIVFFQIIPALMFTLTGFAWWQFREQRLVRSR